MCARTDDDLGDRSLGVAVALRLEGDVRQEAGSTVARTVTHAATASAALDHCPPATPPSRAAPYAAPSFTCSRCSGNPKTHARMPSHSSLRAPPPLIRATSTAPPRDRTRSSESRSARRRPRATTDLDAAVDRSIPPESWCANQGSVRQEREIQSGHLSVRAGPRASTPTVDRIRT
jgi:hypothetical protein